jgi:hypothetical protein
MTPMPAVPQRHLIASALALRSPGLRSMEGRFETRVREELARQPPPAEELLREESLAHLPAPVRRWVIRSGAVGRPKVHGFRAVIDAVMYRKRGAPPMPAPTLQYSFLREPTRLFFMKARMMGLPVRVLHDYGPGGASMKVRVAGLVNVVDARGPEFHATESVTMLNDLSLLAPAALVDPRFGWEAIDDRSAKVTYRSGPGAQPASATLLFDAAGDLVDFASLDRGALQDDGTLVKYRWTTPVRAFADLGGRRVPSRADAIFDYPDGPFTYGSFEVKAIEYNPTAYRPR